jgi:GT2 family glycosyltransferase
MGLKVSVLIHNRNRVTILGRCLESVAELEYRPLEVLVLDAESTDGSQNVIEAAFEGMRRRRIEVRFIPCKPAGCPASRNLAASHATGDLLFFMDNDATIVERDGLGSIVNLFEDDPRLAIVTVRILLEDSPAFDPFAWVFRRAKKTWELRTFKTFAFAGAGFVARASAYREIGGFWERIIYSREEEEMSYALIAAGWRLVYCPALTVRHYPSSRGPAEVAKRRSIELVNGVLVFWRRLPMPLAALAIVGRIGTMTGKSLIRDPRSLGCLWRAVGSALVQVVNFGEPRRPISFAAAWRYAVLHFDWTGIRVRGFGTTDTLTSAGEGDTLS